MHHVANPTTPQTSIPFPLKTDRNVPTRLVAHWLIDANGKLYRIWVSEKI
ncbi:hypothetical protein SAMN06272755_2966 [Picosynechococcus sp. OG1]|nr:hypothetical protein SAMN06272755_2966 [Picosynechococcus sp. OG1]SMQ83260.1 hypothetical protein SAMN06272774_2242 [Synechococcus sp. 7002]